jgi:hypothetical protein
MNKSIKTGLICICVLIVILVGASATFVAVKNSSKAEVVETEEFANSENVSSEIEDPIVENELSENENSVSSSGEEVLSDPDADATIANFAKIGENYTIHGHMRQLGAEDTNSDEISDSLFEGDMEVCINEVNLLDISELNDENYQRFEEQDAFSEIGDPAILQVKLTLTNIDAERSSGVKYDFNSSIFKLGGYKDLIPENYTDSENYYFIRGEYCYSEYAIEPHGEGDAYYHFELKAGESKDYTIYYLIDRSYLDIQEPFLAIASGDQIRFGILLGDKITEING